MFLRCFREREREIEKRPRVRKREREIYYDQTQGGSREGGKAIGESPPQPQTQLKKKKKKAQEKQKKKKRVDSATEYSTTRLL